VNTKALSLIIIFTALAAALNVYGPKIPFPLAPFLYFQLWEIPIVIAFLMIGPRSGLIVGAINTLILFAVFPGELPAGPLYNFAAVLAMMLGIYVPYRFATRSCKSEDIGSYLRSHLVVLGVSATVLAILLRVAFMTVINYFCLQQSYPIGFSMPQVAVLAFLPIGAVFNAAVALYTVPIAIGVTAAVLSRVKIQSF
jgi:riboflavin transporter FmnP